MIAEKKKPLTGKEALRDGEKKRDGGGYVPTNHPRNRIIYINLVKRPQITHHNPISDQQRQKPQKSQRIDSADERSGYVSRKDSAFLGLSLLLLLLLGCCTFR